MRSKIATGMIYTGAAILAFAAAAFANARLKFEEAVGLKTYYY